MPKGKRGQRVDEYAAFINVPYDEPYEPLFLDSCRYSFHDISRVELDGKRPQTPRFNMPFELGLAVALERHSDPPHKWFVLETRKYRAAKSLSDLDGTQVYIHGGKPVGVLKQLANALARNKNQPTVSQMLSVYRDLQKAAKRIKHADSTLDLYETRPYLVLFTQHRYACAIESRLPADSTA